MQYKRGIQITHQSGEVLILIRDTAQLPIVKEGEKFMLYNINAEQAFARAFKTILSEIEAGNALVSTEVIYNYVCIN